jgi:hypothetical protein
MPALRFYSLFLSHAWKYNSDYYNLERLLKSANNFRFRNYSVPTHNPLIDPKSRVGKNILSKELDQQLKPVNCVLILSGMYAAHSEWIQKEILIAQKYGKPIIGVRPRSQKRVPLLVQYSASEIVSWNTTSIISAIRRNSI